MTKIGKGMKIRGTNQGKIRAANHRTGLMTHNELRRKINKRPEQRTTLLFPHQVPPCTPPCVLLRRERAQLHSCCGSREFPACCRPPLPCYGGTKPRLRFLCWLSRVVTTKVVPASSVSTFHNPSPREPTSLFDFGAYFAGEGDLSRIELGGAKRRVFKVGLQSVGNSRSSRYAHKFSHGDAEKQHGCT